MRGSRLLATLLPLLLAVSTANTIAQGRNRGRGSVLDPALGVRSTEANRDSLLLPPCRHRILASGSKDSIHLALEQLSSSLEYQSNAVLSSIFEEPDTVWRNGARQQHAHPLTLRNLMVSANTITASAFNANGRDGLVIDGGSYRATSMLRFTSRGNSTLRFHGDVDLDTPFAELRAAIIEVESGGKVKISGSGAAHTRDARFNRANYGEIEAKGGLIVYGE